MIRMRKQKGRQIYWGSTSSADYLWGSVIQRLAVDQIRFTNPLMPSGKVLKTWKSLTSYGEDRMAPTLPLLQRGQTYVLEAQMTSRPAHTVMLEIVCQDRFGKMVDRQVSTEGQVRFVYPEQAYSYQVRLLSAGMQEFTFHHITISTISSEQGAILIETK